MKELKAIIMVCQPRDSGLSSFTSGSRMRLILLNHSEVIIFKRSVE